MELKIKKLIMKACAVVMGLPPEEAQHEFAITHFELTQEGIENPSFFNLCIEVLDRNANETQRILRGPDAYKRYLDSESVERIAKLAIETGNRVNDLAAAFRDGEQSFKELARASKGIDFKNLSDQI